MYGYINKKWYGRDGKNIPSMWTDNYGEQNQ